MVIFPFPYLQPLSILSPSYLPAAMSAPLSGELHRHRRPRSSWRFGPWGPLIRPRDWGLAWSSGFGGFRPGTRNPIVWSWGWVVDGPPCGNPFGNQVVTRRTARKDPRLATSIDWNWWLASYWPYPCHRVGSCDTSSCKWSRSSIPRIGYPGTGPQENRIVAKANWSLEVTVWRFGTHVPCNKYTICTSILSGSGFSLSGLFYDQQSIVLRAGHPWSSNIYPRLKNTDVDTVDTQPMDSDLTAQSAENANKLSSLYEKYGLLSDDKDKSTAIPAPCNTIAPRVWMTCDAPLPRTDSW